MVVGTGEDSAACTDETMLNQAFASKSSEFFVASENGPREARLRSLIGSDAQLFSGEQITRVVEESILGEVD